MIGICQEAERGVGLGDVAGSNPSSGDYRHYLQPCYATYPE